MKFVLFLYRICIIEVCVCARRKGELEVIGGAYCTGGSLENGRGDEGGGEVEAEVIWKRREGVTVRVKEAERQEEEEEYIVWRKREGFREKRENGYRSERAAEREPEVVWIKREGEEKDRNRLRPAERGQEAVWRKREQE